jgi:hypothetical protein
MPRPRPVRPYIYKPNIKYLIPDASWLWVGLLTFPPWFVLIILDVLTGWRVAGILPVWLFTTPALFVGSVGFFYWARVGRPGRWFEHQVRALFEAPTWCGVLPRDLKGKKSQWLITEAGQQLPTYPDAEEEDEAPRVRALDALSA